MKRGIQYKFILFWGFGLVFFSCKKPIPEKSGAELEARPFYAGSITTKEWDENVLSFNQTEDLLFFTRGKDWQKQLGYTAKMQLGAFSAPELMGIMDTIYNGAISPSGNQIIYCKRQEDITEIWLIRRTNEEWQSPINLSLESGIQGGYFNWFDENTIYLYIPENEGDLALARLDGDQLVLTEKLTKFNTTKGCEFSPFMDKQMRFIIFTRYLEGDPRQQGFFVSFNRGDKNKVKWSEARKIEQLPYGWGAFISNDGQSFYYTDGVDIFFVPVAQLNLKI